jgi:tetratricopeptide (TPR) repeat protein/MinD-like ATPase involved in chromosome partitioning or flagellar assembly
MSRIITFYSYKGGVGRTFALANIAVLLAKRGKRVLLMDWDLEAPGLHRYFKPYLHNAVPKSEGLIHLLNSVETNSVVDWSSYVSQVLISDCEPIDLIASGDQAPGYIERVRSFDWNRFFEDYAGGDLLNRWRAEWKRRYDYVLIDSRTGITDTGGVCTIYLPDILVLVFSANEQSFERGVQIANGVQEARRHLAVPRPPIAVLPLPGRFDGRDEVDEAQAWLQRFAQGLKPFYDEWLPKGIESRLILELTKIPYITKFSFGEPLPVISQGTTDPEFPGFYLENVTRLLVSDFQDVQKIISPESAERLGAIADLRSTLASLPLDEQAIERLMVDIETEIGVSPKFSDLLTEAGVSLLRQQRFGLAETYLRRALAISIDSLGLSHPMVRSSMNHLAELLMTSGRLSEAESLFRQIVEIGSVSEPLELLGIYSQLANACRQTGRGNEAIDWYLRALKMAETTEKNGDPAVIATYNNLAGLYREMGRSDEAAEWYRRALSMAEMSGRPGDPAVIATYNNLAGLYREMGRSDEAAEWYRRALSISMADMSGRSGDPAVIATYNNLAGLFREMGRSDEAAEWYRRALSMAETSGRPGDPAVIAAYNNLAGLYREMGRSDEAAEWYRRALSMAEASGRPGDPAVIAAYNNLAGLYRELGRSDEAAEWYRRALSMAESSGRHGDPAVIAAYNNLAGLYREMGRSDEAAEWYRRALSMAETSGRPGDPTVIAAYNNLAGLYRESGRSEEAILLYNKALDEAQSSNGLQSAPVVLQLNSLAETYMEVKRIDEAEVMLRRALDILDYTLGRDTPVATRIKNNLVVLLQSTGRHVEALKITANARFDIFVSYSYQDKAFVRTLVEKLTDSGFRVWFDQWQLKPGDSINRSLRDAVESASSYLVCIGQSLPGEWMKTELDAILIKRDERSQQIIPVLLPNGILDNMPPFLRSYACLDLRCGLDDESFNLLLEALNRRRREVKI